MYITTNYLSDPVYNFVTIHMLATCRSYYDNVCPSLKQPEVIMFMGAVHGVICALVCVSLPLRLSVEYPIGYIFFGFNIGVAVR